MKLLIDSSKRQNATESTTSFNVRLEDDIKRQSVATLSCFKVPLTWYNINSRNNACAFVYSSTTYTVNPEGRYTDLLDLLADLKTLLDAETAVVFTLSQNAQTGKITVTTSESVTLTYSAGNIWALLGFTSSATGTSLTADNVPSFYALDQFLQLKVTHLESTVRNIDNAQRSTSFVIPIDNVYNKTFGEMVTCDFDKRQIVAETCSDKPISKFHIELCDQNGYTLDLNGCDWYGEIDFV